METSILREEEWRAVRDVAWGLSYFASTRNYTYIDRIADAFAPDTAVASLREALRVLNSEASRGIEVHIPSPRNVETVIKLLYSRREVGSIIAALALASPRREGGEQSRS